MNITKPDYYDSFRCLAGACPDSCCHEWAVEVDEASARDYRALRGDLGEQLRAAMQTEDGETILALTKDNRCPMWREDGLCRIQAELGHDALCQTCREFPRLRHDYGDFVELGLELSCPEAARLILSASGETVTCKGDGAGESRYDRETMAILQRTRWEILRFLGDDFYTVPEALTVLLLYGYAVQDELDGGEPAVLDPQGELKLVENLPVSPNTDLLSYYRGLEILTDRWYQRLLTPQPGTWLPEHRAVARYFVERYWLQAVSDFDLVSRVKLAVCSCLTIKLLGGDVIETAQLYSKEIENDPDNVDAILDGAYSDPALTDANLLALLRM